MQLPGSLSTSILSSPSIPYLASSVSSHSCWWNTDKIMITCNRPSSIYTKAGLNSAKATHILWFTLSQNAWIVYNIIIINFTGSAQCFRSFLTMNYASLKVLDDGPKYNFVPWWTLWTILLSHQDNWKIDKCSYVLTKNCITLLSDVFASGGIMRNSLFLQIPRHTYIHILFVKAGRFAAI